MATSGFVPAGKVQDPIVSRTTPLIMRFATWTTPPTRATLEMTRRSTSREPIIISDLEETPKKSEGQSARGRQSTKRQQTDQPELAGIVVATQDVYLDVTHRLYRRCRLHREISPTRPSNSSTLLVRDYHGQPGAALRQLRALGRRSTALAVD